MKDKIYYGVTITTDFSDELPVLNLTLFKYMYEKNNLIHLDSGSVYNRVLLRFKDMAMRDFHKLNSIVYKYSYRGLYFDTISDTEIFEDKEYFVLLTDVPNMTKKEMIVIEKKLIEKYLEEIQ